MEIFKYSLSTVSNIKTAMSLRVLRYPHPTQQHQAQAMQKLEEFNAAKQMAEFEAIDANPLQIPLQ